MKIVKSLNNNMVLACDGNGDECICQGKGIGWQKKNGDLIDVTLIERKFMPENADESRYFQELFLQIAPEFWTIAERVMEYAKQRYQIDVSPRIILPLCDHMSGSIERYHQGVILENPMLWDVKRIYPKEFKVGKHALELIEKQYGIVMREDEAAFIAWHFVNAELGNAPSVTSNQMTLLIRAVIDMIQQSFQIVLNEEDWNYQRFLTHLKFLVNRMGVQTTYEENENDDLYLELSRKYPHVKKCVEMISQMILVDFHYDISKEEQLYLMIHVERVTRRLQ